MCILSTAAGRSSGRFLLAAIALLLGFSAAQAQLTWNFTYQDIINASGQGFDAAGATGTARRDTVLAVRNYLNTILDARGTINLHFDPSYSNAGDSTLAFAGALYIQNSGFENGMVFRRATANTTPFLPPDGFATVNFGHNWFYTGSGGTGTPGGSQNDFFSVILHEFTHAMGFSSLVQQDGSSAIFNNGGNGSGKFGDFDRLLVRVNGMTVTPLFSTANGATFTGSAADLISNQIFWDGAMATEANGGVRVKIYAPNPWDGSNISHLDKPPTDSAVMKPVIQTGTTARVFQGYEIGMLLDIGWNNFNWDNPASGTHQWSTSTTDANDSRWDNVDGQNMLAPRGSVTHNMILRFGGSGSNSYTANNNIATGLANNRFLLNRLILQSTSSATNTLSGNMLEFGNDNNFGVVPAIFQNNSGAFIISNNLTVNNLATAQQLNLRGDGTGRVTLSGVISDGAGGAAAISKTGTSTFVVSGNNTYSGGTTVTAGTLLANNTAGSGTGSGAVTVQTGATLGGTGRINGNLTVQNGGILAPGNGGTTTSTLTLGGTNVLGVSGPNSAFFQVQLNGITHGSLYDQLVIVSGGSLNLADVDLNATLGYTPAMDDKLFIINNTNANGGLTGTFNSLANGASFTLGSTTAWIYYTGDFDGVGGGTLEGGNDVVLSFQPVPEPLHVLGISLFGAAAFGWWRRRTTGSLKAHAA